MAHDGEGMSQRDGMQERQGMQEHQGMQGHQGMQAHQEGCKSTRKDAGAPGGMQNTKSDAGAAGDAGALGDMQEHQQDGATGDVSWGRFWGCDADGKGCEAGGGSAVNQWWPCLARLAELTAALERRRSEDEEKEQAVEALTLQLRELVGAGCGGFGGGTSIIPGLILCRGSQEAARTREPTPEQVQALRSELQLLRRTLHEVTQVLGHPGATHGQEEPLPASVSPPRFSVQSPLSVACLPQCPLPALVSLPSSVSPACLSVPPCLSFPFP